LLYTDRPTDTEFRQLDAVRNDICVSIYLPSTPVTRDVAASRITLKNLASQAIDQLHAAGKDKRRIAALEAEFGELADDDVFWTYQADGLAVLATPDRVRTYRLPMAPVETAQVSDRFHLKPMVPLLSASDSGFVLALSQNAVRLIEVTHGLAAPVTVDSLPKNMSDALGRQFPRDRAPSGRLQGGEGMKVLSTQFCRLIDRALRPVLAGSRAQLLLACVSELAAIYRSTNTYDGLVDDLIAGNPETLADRELAERARPIFAAQAKQLAADRAATVRDRSARASASTELADIARAAVRGRIATLLVVRGVGQPGTIDPATGELHVSETPGAGSYDLIDELVGLTVRAAGEVVMVEAGALPGDSPVAALYRYAE